MMFWKRDEKSVMETKAEEATRVMNKLGLNRTAKNDISQLVAFEILGEQYEGVEKVGRLHVASQTDKQTLMLAMEEMKKEGIQFKQLPESNK